MAHCRSPGAQPHELVAGFFLGFSAAVLPLDLEDVCVEVVVVVVFLGRHVLREATGG